jgi:hypothetical protein
MRWSSWWRSKSLLTEMVATSALRMAQVMISVVPVWYGRQTVALSLWLVVGVGVGIVVVVVGWSVVKWLGGGVGRGLWCW